MNRKVTVVGGAGNVGATVARAIAHKELADVVIVDVADTKAAGIALDIYQSCAIGGSAARVIGVGATDEGYAHTANSDVVVITSGVPRKPGMSRDDLLDINYKIMQAVTAQVVKHSPNCVIVPVANPLDAMSQAVYRLSGFPRERVIGMAGVLDSARMRTFVATELNVKVSDVTCFVLGGHGDTMVPLAAAVDGGGRAAHRAGDDGPADAGEARRDLHAHGQWRSGDHQADRHERLVCAGRIGRGHDRSHPEGLRRPSCRARCS